MNDIFQTEQRSVGMDALASVFGTGSDNVLMPVAVNAEEQELQETAGRVLKNETLDKVLDGATAKVKEEKEKAKEETKTEVADLAMPDLGKAKEVLDTVITELNTNEKEAIVEAESNAGRPKTDKNAMVSYLKDKIEANDFGLPDNIEYDSTKQSLEDVLAKLPEKDLHSILDSNWKAKEEELRAQTPKEFFESLPEELQYAAAYVAEGGNDLKGLFKALSHVEEVRSLDPANEDHQSVIVKNYLQAIKFGNEEQIAEQIEEWKDNGKLSKKASEYKPSLDDMQKEQVQAQIRIAEEQKKQQQQLATFYSNNVFETLEKNELAGIKLEKKFARELGNNMVTTVPGPYSGRPVNYLGYGLEKAQYTDPDYEAVMLAAWILNDKAAALEALSQSGANKKADDIAKLIKLNQGLGKVGGEQPQIQETKKIKRINTNNVLTRPRM